jgi:L-ascorbate metabolism protein UlaG (beta-lactamase superfamily)
MTKDASQPSFRSARVRNWSANLWRAAILERFDPILPAFAKPTPTAWSDSRVTAAWLGHATVLINFFGIKILTDPVLFAHVGIRLPGITLGPKRLTAPALTIHELPAIDLILLSHAHFDHFDVRTLRRFNSRTRVVTAPRTTDLLRRTQLCDVTELRWGESKSVETATGAMKIMAVPAKHWGARLQYDDHRGYNGYVLEREGRRILFGGDTAFTDSFSELRGPAGIDLAIMSIGCYDPWIRTHCNPEEAVQMANEAGAQFIMPVHHQTFRLSFEPFREPIERFEAALKEAPDRIGLREIGQTFTLPQ